MKLTNKKYGLDVDRQNLAPELFYNCDKKFGHFIEDGSGYVVTDRDTPRDWFQYLCNDNFFSAITNKGLGFTCFKYGMFKVTKYYEEMNYLPRIPNGARKVIIKDLTDGHAYDFFLDCKNLAFTVRPGYVEYTGLIGDVEIKMTVFVPKEDPCECWKVEVKNLRTKARDLQVSFVQDWAFNYLGNDPIAGIDKNPRDAFATVLDKDLFPSLFGFFSCSEEVAINIAQYEETVWSRPETFTKVTLTRSEQYDALSAKTYYVVSGVAIERADAERIKEHYADATNYQTALAEVIAKWDAFIDRNHCKVPDANFQYFVNIWLKNQLDLTYRYCRMYNIGYRDVMQDAWAYTLVDPEAARGRIEEALSYMYTDGRGCRTYNTSEGHVMKDDFCDSPVWIPMAVTAYIQETGNFDFLEEILPYYASEEKGSVKEHVLRSLDLLWQLRGKNGLVLMRDGDWLDGLSGINKFGEDATSVWCTIAAYRAHNQLIELFEETGDIETAALLRERNAVYKKVVNEVAWDGKWLAYAFFEDGEPIGSSKNYEGKIYLNSQTWGIFSGILEDEKKITTVEKSIQRYLMTPFGCQMMQPPYVFYGDRCGRIKNQIPGTFANGAIYNHAASMKIFSDVARHDGEDAFDTFSRCCPNHIDNSDYRRTSEPWAIGNVYYGPDHSHYGMNLFTWFTGCSSWLMQGGFSQILGVKAGYHGIIIDPCVPDGWDAYDVQKTYRGTVYKVHFERAEENARGIWVDGEKIDGNGISSNKKEVDVLVKF